MDKQYFIQDGNETREVSLDEFLEDLEVQDGQSQYL